METLPVEVLSEIFSYLNVRELLTISEVSKTFHSIINSRVFLKKIWADFTNCEHFKKSKRSYVNLKIAHANDEKLTEIHNILSSKKALIRSVRRLKLDDVQVISSAALKDLIMNFQSITELHLEGINLKTISSVTISIKPPHLKVLKFFYSSNHLLHLFTAVSNQLETFKVCLMPHKNEASKNQHYQLVADILQNNCLTIEKLNFYEVNFDDQFLDLISSINLLRLTKFSMSFNSCLTSESSGFQRFVKQNGAKMKKFKIRTFDHINEHHLKVLIEHAENIESLNLIICSSCNYETFSDFSKLKTLEKLKIQPTNYCSTRNFSYSAFIEDKILSHRNDCLKHLTLEMIPNSESIINKIASSFPNLVTLNLSSGFEIKVHADLLKDKLKNLKKLVFNCEDFSQNKIYVTKS